MAEIVGNAPCQCDVCRRMRVRRRAYMAMVDAVAGSYEQQTASTACMVKPPEARPRELDGEWAISETIPVEGFIGLDLAEPEPSRGDRIWEITRDIARSA